MVGRIDAHHHAKFTRSCSIQIRHIAIIQILKMCAVAITLHFWNAKFYWLFGWIGSRRISTPNFVKIGQSVVKVLRFFVFFKMAAATILDCRLLEILIADGVWRSRPITVPNIVKNCRSVTEILRFFEFSRWPPTPSWIFEIAKFYWLLRSRGSRRISMPNFVKIGQSVAKIIWFFDFSRWRPPSPWIVEFAKFSWLTVFGGAIRITVPNFVKIGFCCGDIVIFQIFKMAAAAVSREVTMPLSGMVCCPSAGTSYRHPVHQIWSLYVYSLRRYEKRRKIQKFGWFGGLGVTQGRRKHSHSIECIWLPIRL